MIGRLVGNYRITAPLAEGGMGTVFRGRHQNLPREVVVKTIRLSSFPPRDQEQLKTRFVREAYIQSQLDHPNIVRVFEFFLAEENYYLVMEFIDGMSLRDLILQQGALDPAHALPILKQALWGLSYAHKFNYVDEAGHNLAGIIHRDIKPANLLLDGMGRLKITDFGIVKLAGESGVTKTGFNPGTVEYMSPEQIRGLLVDARSDIYSLGVTFYEALSGRLPFPPSDTGSAYEVMRGHTELTPPPLAEVRPDLPAPLTRLIMRALEKDPEMRFASADEWLNAVIEYESLLAKRKESEVIAGTSGEHANPRTEALTEELAVEAVEAVAPKPSPKPSPELTGRIDAGRVEEAKPIPRKAEPVSAEPPLKVSPPVATSTPVPAAPVPAAAPYAVETRITALPAKSKSSRGGLIAAGVVFLLLVAGIAGYFILLSQFGTAKTGADPVQPIASPSAGATAPRVAQVPAASPVVSEDPRLLAAREAEEAERYPEAIKKYEEYLGANPQAADAPTISRQLTKLKAFNGHLEIAKVWMNQGDFAEARKDYLAALRAKPSSKLAQAGLAEARAQLAK